MGEEKNARLLYNTFPMRWNSARLDSRRVTASNTTRASPFFLFPVPSSFAFLFLLLVCFASGISTMQANWSAMIALRMSPLDEATTTSRMSFVGWREDKEEEVERCCESSAWSARRRRVGAMGLNLRAMESIFGGSHQQRHKNIIYE